MIFDLVSVFCNRKFSVKQLKFEIYIVLCRFVSLFYHSFLQGSENKTKFGEINISDSNFLSSSYGECSQKSVRYGKYTTLNTARFSQLIG